MLEKKTLQKKLTKVMKKKRGMSLRLVALNVPNVLLMLDSDSITLLYFPQTYLKRGHKFVCPRHTSNSLTWPC